jgi:cytochrome c
MLRPVRRARTLTDAARQSGTETGLLGIALDPNFSSNNFIYLFYSVPGPQNEMGTQHISRFTFDPAPLAPDGPAAVADPPRAVRDSA